ncbi:MAG: rRNA maturation RNase YbeY [Bacteroidota bacterium]
MARLSVENTHTRYRIPRRETIEASKSVLKAESLEYRLLNIVFINDRKSRQLNRRFLGHDYATDVLAFRLDEGSKLEGEVYVNLDRARIQARKYRVSFKNEVMRLVIHGLLHLIGYRDTTERLQLRMMRKQEDYLQRILGRVENAGKNH